MKRLALLALGLSLAACAPAQTSAPGAATREAFNLTATVGGAPAPVELTGAGWILDRPEYRLLVDFNPPQDGFRLGRTPTQGFSLTVQNKSTSALRVIWDDSAITARGQTSGLIPDGTKYIDAERSKPALVVPPGATVVKEITPAASVSLLSSGWYVLPLFPANQGKSNVSLYLALEHTAKEGVNLAFSLK